MVREDDVRDVFDALHAGADPALGFSAADVVRAGHRVRRRRRAVAVAGTGLATAAAVVLAVLLPPVGQGNVPSPLEPAGPATDHSTTPAVPVPPTPAPIHTSPARVPGPPITPPAAPSRPPAIGAVPSAVLPQATPGTSTPPG